MTRNEAKKRFKEVEKELSELQNFLDKTCKHRKTINEEDLYTSGDYFSRYQDRCLGCNKILRRA